MPSHRRFAVVFAATVLLLSQPLFAFDSPLSDEAVRQAYFLGQRHDDSLARALDKYTKTLPPPETGPHIAAVTFLTPFALLAQSSSQRLNYSAQQAAIDHRHQKETVKIIVDIRFTSTYGPFIVRPTGTRPDSPQGFSPRPYDFWKDFDVQALINDKVVLSLSSSGEPNLVCSDDGGCSFVGATITLEFLASAFSSSSATILITPPGGDPTSVDFDLTSLR